MTSGTGCVLLHEDFSFGNGFHEENRRLDSGFRLVGGQPLSMAYSATFLVSHRLFEI